MNIKNTLQGALVASAVASLFVAAPAVAKGTKASSKMVKCAGVNECKGKGSCSGADNSCKSQNDCKGKGWVEEKSAKACTTKGGHVVAMNDMKKGDMKGSDMKKDAKDMSAPASDMKK